MRRVGVLVAVLGLVVAAFAAPAVAVAPDRYEGSAAVAEDLADCDGFDVVALGGFEWRGTVFYDRDGNVDRVTEKYKAVFPIYRIDDDGTMGETVIYEHDSWTNVYYPDQLTNVSHGVAYNTIVPGYGPVYKWTGHVEWYWSATDGLVIVENHGWALIPFDPSAEEVLCDYFG